MAFLKPEYRRPQGTKRFDSKKDGFLYNESVYLLKDIFRSRDQDPFIGLICSETQPLLTVGLDIELAAIPT